jgi:hypothetical protein
VEALLDDPGKKEESIFLPAPFFLHRFRAIVADNFVRP